jgi:hypothetical protein
MAPRRNPFEGVLPAVGSQILLNAAKPSMAGPPEDPMFENMNLRRPELNCFARDDAYQQPEGFICLPGEPRERGANAIPEQIARVWSRPHATP